MRVVHRDSSGVHATLDAARLNIHFARIESIGSICSMSGRVVEVEVGYAARKHVVEDLHNTFQLAQGVNRDEFREFISF